MIHKQFLSRDGNATILPPLHYITIARKILQHNTRGEYLISYSLNVTAVYETENGPFQRRTGNPDKASR
jgi:hypothetical protein